MFSKISGVIALVLALGAAQTADAIALYSFEETGGNVVGTLSGILDTSGLGPGTSTKTGIGVIPSSFALFSGPDDPAGTIFLVNNLSSDFGSGPFTEADATSGSVFAIFGNLLILAGGWSSEDSLSGSLTFLGTNFATMGVTEGSYQIVLPNDSITVSFGRVAAAVPLPPSLPLLGAGLLIFGWAARHRRKSLA